MLKINKQINSDQAKISVKSYSCMMLTLTTRKKQFLFGYFSEDVEIAKKF